MHPSHILIVDDDQDTRELYKLIFEVSGDRVSEAQSVASAVEAARRLRPDVVVSDWMLGDGDGIALCRALRRHGPTRLIPVIAATGMTLSAETRDHARQLGCETFLTKPIDLDTLVRAATSTLQVTQARLLRAAAVRVRRYAGRVRPATPLSSARALTAAEVLSASRQRIDASVALIIADDAGQYVAANERAGELTGYAPNVLTTMSVADLTPEPELPAGLDLWNSFIDAGMQEGVYVVKRRDGRAIPLRYVAVANIAPGLHLSALGPAPGLTTDSTFQ
jgi:PAS domain S-box-containing protein